MKKLKKIIIILFMILSFTAPITTVNAWDSNVPHGFTRIKNIRYPQWWGNKVPGIAGWSTYSTMYNGKWAYCLESSKNTPSDGQYVADVIENNEAVRKLMYYGFGGPAPYGEFAAGHDLKAAICPNDSYLTNDDVKYLLTHIFLSGAYSGDWNGFDEQKFNQVFGGTYGSNIMGIYRRILDLPEPTAAKFYPASDPLGKISSFTATVDTVDKQQITNKVKLEGNSNATINIPLSSNVTIHTTDGMKQTGGIATIHGGQNFYFTAPLNESVQDLQLTDVTGSGCEGFVALAIKTGSGTTQTEGSWDWDPDANRLFTQIKWVKGTKITLNKTDNYNEVIKNATFELKQWNKDTSTYELLETMNYNDSSKLYESSVLNFSDSNQGKFKIEETVPEGYLSSSKFVKEFSLDESTEKLSLDASIEGQQVNIKISSSVIDPKAVMYEVYNVPDTVTSIQFPTWSDPMQTDIEWVTLYKNSEGVWQANKYLPKDTAYNIHCYYNTANQLNINFSGVNFKADKFTFSAVNKRIMGKVSVVKTDQDTSEKLANVQFDVVAKNDITTPQGTTILNAGEKAGTIITDKNGYGELNNLNLGTYILKETVPPEGYHITEDQEFTLSSENNDIEIVTVNLAVKDKANSLKIKKIDKDTGKALANAKFELYSVTSDKQIGTYISNQNGEIDISKLSPSTYYIREIQAPLGYKLNDTKYYFDIDNQGNANISDINGTVDDGTFFVDQNGDMTITVKNEINLFNLHITKKNDANKLLEGAEFTLYSDEQCTQEITSGITDINGKLNFDGITVGTYFLKETQAPKGYRELENTIKVAVKNIEGKLVLFINDKEANNDDNNLSIENGIYTANMVVINQRGSLLPATGSTATLILAGSGSILCLYIMIKKVKGKKNEGK